MHLLNLKHCYFLIFFISLSFLGSLQVEWKHSNKNTSKNDSRSFGPIVCIILKSRAKRDVKRSTK
jgi:hypothetical protein